MERYVVVLITVPSRDVGTRIANALVDQKLAACVNITTGVNSLYRWEGKTANDEECLLMAKTKASVFENELVPAVQALHPYQVPEIIALPIVMGSRSYLDWIDQQVKD